MPVSVASPFSFALCLEVFSQPVQWVSTGPQHCLEFTWLGSQQFTVTVPPPTLALFARGPPRIFPLGRRGGPRGCPCGGEMGSHGPPQAPIFSGFYFFHGSSAYLRPCTLLAQCASPRIGCWHSRGYAYSASRAWAVKRDHAPSQDSVSASLLDRQTWWSSVTNVGPVRHRAIDSSELRASPH